MQLLVYVEAAAARHWPRPATHSEQVASHWCEVDHMYLTHRVPVDTCAAYMFIQTTPHQLYERCACVINESGDQLIPTTTTLAHNDHLPPCVSVPDNGRGGPAPPTSSLALETAHGTLGNT